MPNKSIFEFSSSQPDNCSSSPDGEFHSIGNGLEGPSAQYMTKPDATNVLINLAFGELDNRVSYAYDSTRNVYVLSKRECDHDERVNLARFNDGKIASINAIDFKNGLPNNTPVVVSPSPHHDPSNLLATPTTPEENSRAIREGIEEILDANPHMRAELLNQGVVLPASIIQYLPDEGHWRDLSDLPNPTSGNASPKNSLEVSTPGS